MEDSSDDGFDDLFALAAEVDGACAGGDDGREGGPGLFHVAAAAAAATGWRQRSAELLQYARATKRAINAERASEVIGWLSQHAIMHLLVHSCARPCAHTVTHTCTQ